ncbi:MAG: hypothetical protein ACRDPO_30550, partial [Streptosporangiaceae bacterium]
MPVPSAGRPGIPTLPWESLSHRQVLAELATAGWVPCGVGDWAVPLRSPDGTVAARVCPFDPAYWAFVELWGRCDLDDASIYRAGDRPVLLDVYCMAGSDLYRAILDDVAAVHRRIPRERMRYALDIPYIAHSDADADAHADTDAHAYT